MEPQEVNDLAVKSKKDRDSLNSLVKHFQTRLVQMVRQARIHRNDQPDAVQDILLLLMKCVTKFDPATGNFENYLLHSVSKFLITIRSKNGRHHDRHSLDTDTPLDVQASTPVQVAAVVPDEFASLTDMQQEIVKDHFGMGRPRTYSINQIAARRGMTNEKVRTTLREALKRMGK